MNNCDDYCDNDDDNDDEFCLTFILGCTDNWSMTLSRCSRHVPTLCPCGQRKTRRGSGKTSIRVSFEDLIPSLVIGNDDEI